MKLLFQVIPIDFKTEYETKMYRLCSTGYATAFEFSPTKNYGVNYFNYQCTYKPFNPYIRISPNFKGMYGQEFEDNRGLVVSGDFSLPQVTDEWKNYQVNNKNYDVSFNRQLQSMDTQRKYQKQTRNSWYDFWWNGGEEPVRWPWLDLLVLE